MEHIYGPHSPGLQAGVRREALSGHRAAARRASDRRSQGIQCGGRQHETLDPTRSKASKDRLTGLVQRFDKYKKSKHQPNEALTELDDILKNARAGVGELKQSVPAPPPPSLPNKSKAIPTDRFQLMFEKKQLEDKLGKNSYIGEDDDRAGPGSN